MSYFDLPVISFPGLGIEGLNPSNVAFTIFGKDIYWYALIIAFGFLLAYLYGTSRGKQFGVTTDSILDAILFAVPLAIVGARLYYVAFQWDYYKTDLVKVFYVWEGGLAIYGGVIGASLGLILFSLVKKQKLTPYLDIMALGLLIGQSIGRWGNFMNREAYGAEITGNFFLRMGLTERGVTTYWHPTFLYESVWNLTGFVLLHFLSKKRKYDGQVFLMYLGWYGLGRVCIEGLRTDSLYIPGTAIRVSQLLAGICVLVSLALLLYFGLFRKPDPEKMMVNQAARRKAAEEEEEEEEEFPAAPAEEAAAADTEETHQEEKG